MLMSLFLKKNELNMLAVLGTVSYDKLIAKDTLAKQLNITRPSLDRYVKQLNGFFLEKHELNCPQILNIGQSLVLTNKKESNSNTNRNLLLIEKLKDDLNFSYEYKIVNILCHQNKIDLDTLLNESMVTPNYLNQIFTNINRIIKPYNLSITNSKNMVSLCGPPPHLILFSYLFCETKDKLFLNRLERTKKQNEELMCLLNNQAIKKNDIIRSFRANTLYEAFIVLLPELANFSINSLELKECLEAIHDSSRYFSHSINNLTSNTDAHLLINFLTHILFSSTKTIHKRTGLTYTILESENLTNNSIVNKTKALSEYLLQFIPAIKREDRLIFNYSLFLLVVYLELFKVDIRELFDDDSLKYLLFNGQDDLNTLDLALLNDMHLKSNPNHPLFESLLLGNLSLFSNFVNTFYRKTLNTHLNIVVDFQTNVMFEYYLIERLSKIFNPKTFSFTNDMSQADIIISDKIYEFEKETCFFFYINPASQKLLDDVCAYISHVYFKKIIQNKKLPLIR